MLAERQLGMLHNTTESNLREHVKAITLRSSKQLSSSLPTIDDDVIVHDEPARTDLEPEMPRYARFLKEILSNKRKLEDLGLVTLNEECSAIFQNKLPVKRHDLGSFTVTCIFGDLPISDALADLGASINLMPSSLFEKLGLSEPQPTRMSIQLAYRTVKYPRGIVEDVLVKVDKFIFPVDFVVMDMEGESSVPLILGRPFLATSRAVVDVCDGKLQLREILLDDPLQVALQADEEEELSNEDALERLACLLASPAGLLTILLILTSQGCRN
ncbi:uncharacterized protein LOC125369910 [Ricinus communis]|uniref:uncharacterized protein LOC125369910 n=1 Tax=Ricinus communis TaxID=3988 RepID=UPI00201B3372|nr:uncharacterized protein LOC125369910 [Ricinus communis]